MGDGRKSLFKSRQKTILIMADTFKFWTHGAALIPEYTAADNGANNGLNIRRAGFGTVVRQTAGTWNWFHLAVPSPTRLDDDVSRHIRAWLDVQVNNFAVITHIHVREGGSLLHSMSLNHTGQNGIVNINVPDGSVSRPICICVRARFDTNAGMIIFRGAGMEFEEVT